MTEPAPDIQPVFHNKEAYWLVRGGQKLGLALKEPGGRWRLYTPLEQRIGRASYDSPVACAVALQEHLKVEG